MPADKKDKKKQEDATPTVLKGVYMFPNGDKYEGDYTHGTDGSLDRCGLGIHVTTDGTMYEGEWANDKMNGTGTLTHPSGAKYEGSFVNNQFHGLGTYTWPNASSYTGQFVENKLEGQGEFTDTDGQVWVGTFRYRAAPGLRFKLNLD